jgi:hypothetical protein
MELRVKIDDTFMKDLGEKLRQTQLGEVTGTRITQEALSLLKWAVEETSKGRLIVSTDQEAKDIKQVVMPSLSGSALLGSNK